MFNSSNIKQVPIHQICKEHIEYLIFGNCLTIEY
jgi:hypothetical protein